VGRRTQQVTSQLKLKSHACTYASTCLLFLSALQVLSLLVEGLNITKNAKIVKSTSKLCRDGRGINFNIAERCGCRTVLTLQATSQSWVSHFADWEVTDSWYDPGYDHVFTSEAMEPATDKLAVSLKHCDSVLTVSDKMRLHVLRCSAPQNRKSICS
jgi:hypothetical protein